MTSGEPKHDARAVLRNRNFQFFLGVTFLSSVCAQMITVAVGWELYDRTGSALSLGLVGLVELVPVVLLALPAGQIVDKHDRKLVALGAFSVIALASFCLAAVSFATAPLILFYGCLALHGAGRSFQNCVMGALTAQVVQPEDFQSAATWESSVWQASAIGGPALGGVLIALFDRAGPVYVIAGIGMLTVAALTVLLKLREVELHSEPVTKESLLAGYRFLRSTKLLLAAMTLDMFAVLLGGATALLPLIAKDILHIDSTGLGLLRAAPAVGAVTAGLSLTVLPPFKHAGNVLLGVVAGFGLATIVFGLSRNFWLSLAMLACLGALDNVSVVIRSTLFLNLTPDELRGRVNSVHFVFIGLSNEMGAFESGVAAALMGATPAIVIGGIGTLLVVPAIAHFWPEIRRLGRLDSLRPKPVILVDAVRVGTE